MNTTASDLPLDAAPAAQTNERLWPTLTVAPFLAWLADYLFWWQNPGASVAAFFSLTAVLIFILHARTQRQRQRAGIACGLLVLSSIATVWEVSWTNTVVLVGLLAVVVGESFYAGVPGATWARWSQALRAWLCAFGRWPWLFRQLAATALVRMGLSKASGDVFGRSMQVVVPAFCLGGIFLVVFQLGNAVFREFCTRISATLTHSIENIDLSPDHFLFWLAMATLALALVQPRSPVLNSESPEQSWSRFERKDRAVAVWQSRSILVVLNALFFTVNTIDAACLWRNAKLPAGVTYSEFAHDGVGSLIFATLLSALVLAAMFQQSIEVVRSRGLKALALLWIAQNLVLIASVFLRLKLYVDAYQLSEQRVYVGCFLLLVTAGFGLLAWHVMRDGSLSALIFQNVLATFALFFVLQFLDVAGHVARFNVDRWRQDRRRELDIVYLESLGPGGWPALCEVASPNEVSLLAANAREQVVRLARSEAERRNQSDWRSFQVRRQAADKALFRVSDEFIGTSFGVGPN
ncbi:MAG TPA: DUF4173 domain-containing protein [Chthoniobacter sp.]|jgi:hypothetical protein